jgi:Trk K+ transport system NAD-binding subunit
MALAKQLDLHGWEVKVVHKNSLDNQKLGSPRIVTEQVSSFTLLELETCGINEAGAIVTMLSDEENLKICEWTYENFGSTNLVVLLNEHRNYEVFEKLGAFIVSPSTAIISLLDHFVRSPSVVSLLFGLEEGHDIVDLEARNPNLDGMAIKDLRLPPDSLILSIHRKGHLVNAHGYTRLKLHDQVTVTGSNESLEAISLRFEG